MSVNIEIVRLTPVDRAWMVANAAELWNGEFVISRGVAHRVSELPGFVARSGDERVGVATYRFGDDDCELVTIDALRPHVGVGTALLSAVIEAAGDRRLWLITTNDNLDAVRFYQRRGFVLEAVCAGTIEHSRRLKPQIPHVGDYGIPIRDELLLAYSGPVGTKGQGRPGSEDEDDRREKTRSARTRRQ